MIGTAIIIAIVGGVILLWAGTANYDVPIDTTDIKVFVYDIPEYSHESITTQLVDESLRAWENVNPDVSFAYVDDINDADIEIGWTDAIDYEDEWVVGLTYTDHYEGEDEVLYASIEVDLVDTDCNGNPVYWTDVSIRDTITHELGHALGILGHSNDESNLMYDEDAESAFVDTMGYILPAGGVEQKYILEVTMSTNCLANITN